MDKAVCGAKTRQGTPCQKTPLKNGRCRLHGGKSTGPKDKEKKSQQMKGNKNAVITGEYETISFDTLLEDEKELYSMIPEDIDKQVKGRYKLLEIRTLRLMKRYSEELLKKKPDFGLINRLEEALIRIDARAIELLREMRELSAQGTEGSTGSLDRFTEILAKVREDRKGS